MNEVVVIAALNSGLRGRRGHVTLVSNRRAAEDAASERIAYITGLIRMSVEGSDLGAEFVAGDDFLIGKDFLGVAVAASQETSHRSAPEVFLIWNCRTSGLTEGQRTRALDWLRELSGDRGALIGEVTSGASTQTVVFSETLSSWSAAYCSQLPAGNGLPKTAHESARLNGSQASGVPLRWTKLIPIGVILGLAIGGILAIANLPPGRKPENVKGDRSDEPAAGDTDEAPVESLVTDAPDIDPFRNWQADAAALERGLVDEALPLDRAVNELAAVVDELTRASFRNDDEYRQAYDLIGRSARTIRDRVTKGMEADADELRRSLESLPNFEDLRESYETARAKDQLLADLEATVRPLPIPMESTGDVESARDGFLREVEAAVVARASTLFASTSDRASTGAVIGWVLRASESEFGRELAGFGSSRRLGGVFRAISRLETTDDVEIIVTADEVPFGRPVKFVLVDGAEAELVFSGEPESNRGGLQRFPQESGRGRWTVRGVTLKNLLACRRIIVVLAARGPRFAFEFDHRVLAKETGRTLCPSIRVEEGRFEGRCEVLLRGDSMRQVLAEMHRACELPSDDSAGGPN